MKKTKISLIEFSNIIKRNVKEVNVYNNKYFRELTTFRVGGKIKCLIEINNINSLLKVMFYIKKYNLEYFILGAGSNILATNSTFNKVVLKISLVDISVKNNLIICGAGVGLFKLNQIAIKNSLSGLEWSFGIPGSVGGAVYMNAGSFGGEIKDIVKCVYFTDGEKIFKKDKKSLEFDYRKSFFTDKNLIILKVVFELHKGLKKEIEKLCYKNYENRRKTQPFNLPCAGSVFKRPKIEFAPVLIEKCGLKGVSCGGAEISTKHCGFIVNKTGDATFNQILKLISKIKKTVSKKFDIILEEEIIILR